MKPKPFSSENHLTVPVAMGIPPRAGATNAEDAGLQRLRSGTDDVELILDLVGTSYHRWGPRALTCEVRAASPSLLPESAAQRTSRVDPPADIRVPRRSAGRGDASGPGSSWSCHSKSKAAHELPHPFNAGKPGRPRRQGSDPAPTPKPHRETQPPDNQRAHGKWWTAGHVEALDHLDGVAAYRSIAADRTADPGYARTPV